MRLPPFGEPHQPLDIRIVGRNNPALERIELLLPCPINLLQAGNPGLAVIPLAYGFLDLPSLTRDVIQLTFQACRIVPRTHNRSGRFAGWCIAIQLLTP
ncbi:MAG TPA: hypothetical protein VF226_10990 [Hyphomicrobiaceae bacterium]